MKKSLLTSIAILFLFLISVHKVEAQVSSGSAEASDSAASTGSATTSGDLELPDTLPVTGSHDVLFFISIGLVLIAAGFSGLVSGKQILEEFD